MPEQKTLAVTGNIMVAEAMRQCAARRDGRLPDHSADDHRRGVRRSTWPRPRTHRVRHRRVRALGHERLHRRLGGRRPRHDRHVVAGPRAHVGGAPHRAGMRLPIVMANANRALSAPINIHCDHSDIMGARDTGWVILFAETAQEAYDNTIMSVRIAEHPDVMLPVMSTLDGFITTHSIDRAQIMDDETVKAFVGEYVPENALLDTDEAGHARQLRRPRRPVLRVQEAAAHRDRPPAAVIKAVGDEWSAISGRPFDVIEGWGMEDAEIAIVVLGSTAGNARHVARELRAEGVKVGVLKVRGFRPFPSAELAAALKGCKAVAVLDRCRELRRRGRPAVPRGPERAVRPRHARSRRGLHLRSGRRRREARAHRARVSATCPTSPSGYRGSRRARLPRRP